MNDQIPVSEYPEWLRKCPGCGKKGGIEEWHEPNGPDDYRKVWYCKYCKERFDE